MTASAIATTTLGARGLHFDVDLAGPVDGDLVVLLHGFPQTRHTWRAELEALAAAGYRACAPDQRGYSAGARPTGIEAYRYQEMVADTLAIAEALGQSRFHLVGHDWGGQIAWLTAARHADRVRSLAVISRPHPAAFVQAMRDDGAQAGRSGHHAAFQRPEATDELLADDAAGLRAIYSRWGVAAGDAAAYLATLRDRDTLDAAINWYRAVRDSRPLPQDAAAVTVPTLYVWGDADATVGRTAAEGTAAWVDAPYRFVAVPGIGHFVTDEAPQVFPPLLLEHLRAHPG